MEAAEQGQAWWRQAASLEAAWHVAEHAGQRAALATDSRRESLAEADLRLAAIDRPEPTHHRRDLSSGSYRLILLGLALGEAYFSYLSLLALGEDRLRWAGVLTLGIALLVLARALGAGWREVHDEHTKGLTGAGLIVITLAATALVTAQALLRSQAVSAEAFPPTAAPKA